VSETWTRTDTGFRRDVTTAGVKRTLSMIRRAGSATLVAGIEILPFASLIWPAGPEAVVVVVVVVAGTVIVVVAVLVDVDVEVLVELDVELLVDSVDVVPVEVESASGLS
jgi:hypothetical protein